MTYTIHDPRLFYDAIATRLATSGRPIGEAIRPAPFTYPYAVIFPMSDIANDGSLNNPTQISVYSFQVSSFGLTMEQAQWMQEKAREVLLGWTPTVTGMGTTPIDRAGDGQLLRDDDVSPPVFSAIDRFRMYASS